MVIQRTFQLSLHPSPIPTHPGESICSRKCEGTRTREPFPATRLRNKAFPPPKLKEIKESGLMGAGGSFSLSVTRLSGERNGSELCRRVTEGEKRKQKERDKERH